MNIQEMHYDFKIKLNKLDSEQYRNLLVPEIDWLLNSATELFIKMINNPRYNPIPGFEKTRRDTEDLKNIVVNSFEIIGERDENLIQQYIFTLPEDYLYYVSAKVQMDNPNCGLRIANLKIRQHEDEFIFSIFDKSSYEWKIVNGVFDENGIRCFVDDSFHLRALLLTYIRQYPYMHNANAFYNNTYTDLQGNILTWKYK